MVPSSRLTVPSSAWSTPLPACGEPLTETGGQVAAHAPAQVDAPLLSASNRYMVRPWAPTKNLPGMPEIDDRLIIAAVLPDDALAAAAGLLAWTVADDAAGAAVLPEPELEHAVAARAIPAASAAVAIQFFM